ncbi:hypothetical protein [Streptomyces sp. NPDC005374]|uniref:hypothetical protein n=1 Tax=Streptomyces sp. NPDC005374 TaxID=3364713 RepID=UPI00368CFFA9
MASTDLTTSGEHLVARYASRWSIEQSIKDGKNLLSAGDAQNRLPAAVERTTPLGLANLTLVVLWYDHAGHPALTSTPAVRTPPGTATSATSPSKTESLSERRVASGGHHDLYGVRTDDAVRSSLHCSMRT